MAKTVAAINPNVPEEAEAIVRQLIEAHPGQLSPEHFRFRVAHLADPTSSVGRTLGNIDYLRFSEEAVAQAWGLAGDFYADLQCSNVLARGNLRRIRFGIAEQLLPQRPAGLGGFAAPAPTATAPAPLDLTALLLAQMKQQGDLVIAMLGRPSAPAAAPVSDRLMEILLTQALTKTPASDLLTFFDAMKKRTGAEDDDQDDDRESRGGGLAVEALRLFRQLAKSAPTPTPAPITTAPAADAPRADNPPMAAASASAQVSPGGAPTNAAGAERVDPAKLSELDRLRLFGQRVVPQLIDFATDPVPSVAAAAAMVEATAIRSGIEPTQFADADDVAADIVDPVIGFYPELADHRAFAIAAVEAVAEQYEDDEDDDEPGE